jgi:arylsulfatase A-like enzyme
VAFVDNHKPFRVPPEEFQKFVGPDHDIAPYRAVLRRVDDELGRLVSGLAERGITEDNTIFVFVGDHGEGLMMPPHHRKQHGRVLYESVVRIPWVMWGRGVASGKRVEGLASQLDVVPTVRSLAGVPLGEVDGLDLSAVVTGATSRTGRTSAYADTYFEGADRASIWTDTRQCQRDYGSEGITDSQFQDGCFDRAADPTFTKVLQDEALLAQLDAERAERLKELEK